MRKYLSFFRIRFKVNLQYRTAALAGVSTQFFWGFMTLMMFRAFYRSDPSAIPMPFDQLSTYVWLQQGLIALIFVWFWEGTIFTSIENGTVAYELCRPISLYNMWTAKILSTRCAKTLLRMVPLFAVTVFLPAPFNLSLPPSAGQFALFLLTLALGVMVLVNISMIIYSLAFYTISSYGLRIFTAVVVDFMAGGIIPLPFFPEAFRQVAELLPFSAIANVPLRIYAGHISGPEALYHVALQIGWLLVLTAFSKAVLKKATRRVVVQGG